jgi:hypothetical protein
MNNDRLKDFGLLVILRGIKAMFVARRRKGLSDGEEDLIAEL